MSKLISQLENKGIVLPEELLHVLSSCKSYTVYDTVDQLTIAAMGGSDNGTYEVSYDIPGKGLVTEAIVHKVQNGISANYTEPYMRRRDPDTMAIADNFPTDKDTFQDKFGYSFDKLKGETFDWLKEQDLVVFLYFAGREGIGVGGIAVAPANAGFFAMGLAMLQVMVPTYAIPAEFGIDSIIYVAPTFRHTHFNGKQIVVYRRSILLPTIWLCVILLFRMVIATGKMVHHANMLLEQVINTPATRFTLVPNQYIGVWKVGFKPQLLMREYLTRRGNANLRKEQYQAARCPLLGYELNYLTIEGAKIPSRFLQVYKQDEVGKDGYDEGASKLYDFFKEELKQYLTAELNPKGREIIEACLRGASVAEYEAMLNPEQ